MIFTENKTINGIHLRVAENEWQIYYDMAMTMLEEIIDHNSRNEPTVMIVPVGPTQQYPILADMVNRLHVSLKNVLFFNMDEYLISEDKAISSDNILSFHKRMDDEFYSRVSDKLNIPESNRHFPTPGKETEYDRMIEAAGGVDLCLGGLGINGHIAFNEPPADDANISTDEFAALGTRILPITRETRTVNAFGYLRGDIGGMPKWCITVGMKQILNSRKIYIALNKSWQHGIFKHIVYEEPKPQIPASLLKMHNNVVFCVHNEIIDGLQR